MNLNNNDKKLVAISAILMIICFFLKSYTLVIGIPIIALLIYGFMKKATEQAFIYQTIYLIAVLIVTIAIIFLNFGLYSYYDMTLKAMLALLVILFIIRSIRWLQNKD